MLRARIAAWFRRTKPIPEPEEGREAFQSDIRALRPEAWSTTSPPARGREVERAMWLAGISSQDFSRVVDIDLSSPHLVTPVDDIIGLCRLRARACEQRAQTLGATLPPPNPYGRPPLPWHRSNARQAQAFHRASQSWDLLARALLSNRWER